jgi:hypothetical protein
MVLEPIVWTILGVIAVSLAQKNHICASVLVGGFVK